MLGHTVEIAVWVAAACQRLTRTPLSFNFVLLITEQQAGTVSHNCYSGSSWSCGQPRLFVCKANRSSRRPSPILIGTGYISSV